MEGKERPTNKNVVKVLCLFLLMALGKGGGTMKGHVSHLTQHVIGKKKIRPKKYELSTAELDQQQS
jgi:hypothetical protein